MTDEVVRQTIEELKRQGVIKDPSPLYVPPEIHKEHHDFLGSIWPWIREIRVNFRRRVVNFVFYVVIVVMILFFISIGDIKAALKSIGIG